MRKDEPVQNPALLVLPLLHHDQQVCVALKKVGSGLRAIMIAPHRGTPAALRYRSEDKYGQRAVESSTAIDNSPSPFRQIEDGRRYLHLVESSSGSLLARSSYERRSQTLSDQTLYWERFSFISCNEKLLLRPTAYLLRDTEQRHGLACRDGARGLRSLTRKCLAVR